MEKNSPHIYPTWHWLWNTRVHKVIYVLGTLLFLLTLYGLLQNNWLLSLILAPLFVALLFLGKDENFKRGHIPNAVLKHMLKRYRGKQSKPEAFYILKRAYELAATNSPEVPKDIWLTRFYLGLAITGLAKSEQGDLKAYDDLRDFIFSRYY